MLAPELLLICAIVALVMLLTKSLRWMVRAAIPTRTSMRVTMATGRITCKDCGKTWPGKTEFDEDKGCDRGWCINTEESILSRRRGRQGGGNKPPHIDIKKEGELTVIEIVRENPNPKIRRHETTSQVLSLWDKDEPVSELIIDDAININLFVR
jgi:hypothetical protein